jgi:probable F420-dependent oxidoreductase
MDLRRPSSSLRGTTLTYAPVVRPFRFAVQLSGAPDGKAWRALARQIEDLGYSTLYMPDHFDDQWAPLVGLTAAADATTSLRVGSLVFDNDYRHPVELAKEIATLSVVSEGRVEVGLGAGWMQSDYDESGIPYDRAGIRIQRMVEGLQIMKDLWTEGTSTRSGRHYRVTKAQGLPRPHEGKCPPVIIGGGGKRILSVAAREADIIGFNPSLAAGSIGPDVVESALPESYRERVAWVKEAAGDRLEQVDCQVLTFVVQVVPNRDEFLAQAAPLFGVTSEQAAEIPLVLVGTVDQICDTLQARRAEYGFNSWVVHEADMTGFAPVVDRLAGE